MININVFSNEKAWSKRLRKKELFFDKVCKAFPKKYKFFNKKVSFTLLLSNNKNIKKLNKDFRNKNKSTDILSFPFSEKIKILKESYLGDIIISYNFIDKPKSQDLKFFKKKLIKIFIHGFLHLVGFNHIKDKDYKKMLKEEDQIYKSVISKLN
ncbi:MAG: rRNA maturation RNase YbeY [Pelagibacterales bacterium MED-G41]|nr:MAG: rRNA maturation RNase YbeY [Pelagibacterales bacterium MED-G41]